MKTEKEKMLSGELYNGLVMILSNHTLRKININQAHLFKQ